MPDKPRILNAETIARTRLFHVEELDLQFSNGSRETYERLKGSQSGAVLIIPMLDNDTVLLIKEYAAGVHRYEVGLPKGKIEGGETPVEAANREIMEEVGYGAHKLEHITSFTLAPGYIGHTTHVVLASNLYEQRLQGDEPEEIEVIPWKLSKLPELLCMDNCTEARSIAALYLARDIMQKFNDE